MAGMMVAMMVELLAVVMAASLVHVTVGKKDSQMVARMAVVLADLMVAS